jgi:hypothetical protein
LVIEVLFLYSSQDDVITDLPEALEREEKWLGESNCQLPFFEINVALKLVKFNF